MQEGLSKAALEVLSIVAYKGPISRAEIESIRGVNCSFTLRSLMMRGLLERIDNPKDGRGYLYKISFEFMKKLGIESIDKLPDYKELSQDSRIESVIG
jgi:segregation and condensation protein B